jgi:L-alanine-DL-glutamate epimerase-like enolase superfamily enzyme
MNINDLELFAVEIKRSEANRPLRSLLVRLATDEGVSGWGEATVGWRGDELAERRSLLLSVIAGRSIFDIEDLLLCDALGDPRLRCAVEMAFWDLLGKATGQPICHLLGGGFRQRIPIAVRLPNGKPHAVARIAGELAEQGFHSQIVTATGNLPHDLELFRAVGQSAGDRAELRIDGAGLFNVDDARQLCGELENERLEFLIDPLREGTLEDIVALCRETSVPLAAWRMVTSAADVLALSRRTAMAALVVDPQNVGGITAARKCAAVAEAAGMCVMCGGSPALGIGTAAMLQLAAATPAFSNANESTYHQLQDDVLTASIEIIDGMTAVPQGPGLGVDVDRAKVEEHQVA